MGIVGHSQHFGKWVRKKGERGRDYFTCYGRNLISNCIFIHESKNKMLSCQLGHCVVCSSIYGFWLPLWYLQTLLWTVTTFCQVQEDQTNVHNSGILCVHWWLFILVSYLSRIFFCLFFSHQKYLWHETRIYFVLN
jgi:hypothetical protein